MMKKMPSKDDETVEVPVPGDEVPPPPQGRVARGQAWFWTKEWQEMEREADEAIASGDVSPVFETGDEAIAYLRRDRE